MKVNVVVRLAEAPEEPDDGAVVTSKGLGP